MARESIHKKLERVRSPRVHVTYDVEIGGAIEMKEIPFVAGVMADLTGMPAEPLPRLKDRRFVEITPDNFDKVLESMKPRVAFSVENELSDDPNAGNLGVDLTFKTIDDFGPEQVARNVKPLAELLELRTRLSDLVGNLQGNEKLEQLLNDLMSDPKKLNQIKKEIKSGRREPNMAAKKQTAEAGTIVLEQTGLLDRIVNEGRLGRDEASRDRGRGLVSEFVGQVLEGQMTVSPDLEAMINARIAQIDHLVSLQLNRILHHPKFQQLEATWRGVRYLVEQSETGVNLKIKLFNASKKEVLRDLQRVPEFDQSQTFKKVYEQEFGVFGGEPFSCLIGDYEFSKNPEDIEFLERISQVAAGAHAPFISAAAPELLNLESFTQLDTPRDLAKVFDTTEYARWKGFRASDDSRYVCLTMPRVLVRVPYGRDTRPVDGFNYEENVTGNEHDKYLWGNAAYALGARITNAFSRYGWCAAIRGVEGGGLVEALPSHIFKTDDGDVALKCPTETIITDRREKELADLGFAPLVHCKGTDYAAFFSVQSAQKAKSYDTEQANANARLSAQIPYIMAVSRFAHYLKAMMRDKIGSFQSRKDCEVFLNRWIMNYVTPDDTASADVKARFPLREARVDVLEVPGKPGVFRAITFLRPHFQLDELSVSLRLVAELPHSARN